MSGLFDSLSHPTLTGSWFGRDLDASWPALVKQMRENGFSRACAVGLAGIEGYEHEAFIDACKPYPELVPIAGVDPRGDVDAELRRVQTLGFAGIKLHPRLSDFSLGDDCLIDAFRAAGAVDLPVFLCTYCHQPVEHAPLSDPLYGLARALRAVPDVRLVLLHGGDVELMRYMQLVRHSPNILIDLSFTMMKYAGSSLDLDLAYIMRGFNRRTCFGVDHPEYAHVEVRARFDALSAGMSDDERTNVGSRNLARFLRLPDQPA
jgi:predicted TIM-barrel fold metal-dependent hydrolase